MPALKQMKLKRMNYHCNPVSIIMVHEISLFNKSTASLTSVLTQIFQGNKDQSSCSRSPSSSYQKLMYCPGSAFERISPGLRFMATPTQPNRSFKSRASFNPSCACKICFKFMEVAHKSYDIRPYFAPISLEGDCTKVICKKSRLCYI